MCADRSIQVRSSGCCFISDESSTITQITDPCNCTCRVGDAGQAAWADEQMQANSAAAAIEKVLTGISLDVEPPRPAQIRVAWHKEAQPLVGALGQSNAHAFADRINLVTIAADPELPVREQIQFVVPEIHAQCGGQTSRAARQVLRLYVLQV